MQNILVTGGAGYIGSHAVYALLDEGFNPVVFDNFSTGYAKYLPKKVIQVRGDLESASDLDNIFSQYHFDAVMHFAGSIIVPESVSNPEKYYLNNTFNTLGLLNKMLNFNVKKLVFSSSAAIYGNPESSKPIKETSRANPINPYGASKWMSEIMIKDIAHAHGLKATCLRYFNVAGADDKGRTGQSFPLATHLIKRAVRTALGRELGISVFGQDYSTIDGSGVRDYVHVSDLVNAHILALHKMENQSGVNVFNCGYGKGYSVLEVIAAVEQISGEKLDVTLAERRNGDTASLIACSEKIKKELNWKPLKNNLTDIIKTALAWEKKIQ